MHSKYLKTLAFGALCACASTASAKAPSMSEYFSFDRQYASAADKETIILDTLVVDGSSEAPKPEVQVWPNRLGKRMAVVPDDVALHFGLKLYIVTDLGDDDLFSGSKMQGSPDFIRRLRGERSVDLPYTDTNMKIYIKSGLAWQIRRDWTIVAPYIRGRVAGMTVRWNIPSFK